MELQNVSINRHGSLLPHHVKLAIRNYCESFPQHRREDDSMFVDKNDVPIMVYGGSTSRTTCWIARIGNKSKRFSFDSSTTEHEARIKAGIYLQETYFPNHMKATISRIARWNVALESGGKTYNRSFSDRVYGSKDKAKKAADAYRKHQSNLLGRTVTRITSVPQSFQIFTAGFWDSDGYIYIVLVNCPHVIVEFPQSCDTGIPDVLEKIRQYYGGTITARTTVSTGSRQSWHLRIRGRKAQRVMQDLCQYSTLKRQQAQIGLECIEAMKAKDTSFDWQGAKQRLFELRRDHKNAPVPEKNMGVSNGCVLGDHNQLVCGPFLNETAHSKNAEMRNDLKNAKFGEENAQTEVSYGGQIVRYDCFTVRTFQGRKSFTFDSSLQSKENARCDATSYLQQVQRQVNPNTRRATLYKTEKWSVRFETKSKIYTKSFSDAVYGSKEQSKQAADLYRKHQSDSLGRTTVRIIDVPEEFRMYTAFFWDGDGCLSIESKDGRKAVVVAFVQSQNKGTPKVLSTVQSYYGGKVTKKTFRNPNHRTKWVLRISGKKAQKILQHLCTYSVLKYQQAQIGLECIDALANKNSEFNWKDATQRVCILRANYRHTPLKTDRLTVPGIAGLFDAEGYVGVSKSQLRASIAQSSCPALLESIRAVLITYNIHGRIDGESQQIYFTCQNLCKLAKLILPYSIVKKAQLELAIEYRTLQEAKQNKLRRKQIALHLTQLKLI